jgi:two-component system, chemotaxis family, sensor kinase CheA
MAADPYRYFRVEAREILEGIGKGLLGLEKGSDAKDIVPKLLRLAHTLKGAARVVRQKDIADLAHGMEDVLQPLREGTVAITRELIDDLLRISDDMEAKVKSLTTPGTGAAAPAQPVREESVPILRADAHELEALVEGVAELGTEIAGLRHGTSSLAAVRHLAEVLHQRLGLRATDSQTSGAAKLRATAEELLQRLASTSRDVNQSLERIDRELSQVAETAERLKLVAAGSMFNALERAARDAGVSVGKRVELEARGGEVRLDPEVLSAVQGALVQAVRNACAHGVESEAERQAAGKARIGRITVEISRHGSRVRFACRDDGRGIDFDAVRRVAEGKSKAVPQAERLDERRLLELLLQGGISTSSEVTSVSGRGVGLDVVRETAQRLGGEARLSSEAHRGTLLEIIVPVVRSALDALLVEAEGQVVAIPLDSVRRTLRVAPTDVTRTAEGDSIVFEGGIIPFAPLVRSLRRAARTPGGQRAWSAVLLESGAALAAVGVDRLLGTETIVARPSPDGMPGHAAVAGVTLDADGNPRLVLDAGGLIAGAVSAERDEPSAVSAPAPILVIDDSLTTRMLEQSILESAGYEVEVAVSGEDALEKARLTRFSLFLVDVEMPGIDGFTFVERARADPTLRDVPAILVTSRSSDEDRRRGESAGASAYIVKGEFDQTELLRRIRALVS